MRREKVLCVVLYVVCVCLCVCTYVWSGVVCVVLEWLCVECVYVVCASQLGIGYLVKIVSLV